MRPDRGDSYRSLVMMMSLEHYHMTRIAHRGWPVLVWVRDPLPPNPLDGQVGHTTMAARVFQAVAAGQGIVVHQQIMMFMANAGLHVYIVERGPVQHLGLEDVRAITLRALAGEFSQPTSLKG